MDDLLSEKEQIDELRNWWSTYGAYVIGGLVLGIALLVGVNYYQNAKLETQLAASAKYDTLVEKVAAGGLDEAELAAAEIDADYATTSYAAQAKLVMSRMYMDQNRDQDAADALSALIASDTDESMKNLARVRLARVLAYQEKPQDVIDLLDGQEAEGFAALFNELRGDAYAELGQFEAAQAAYQAVMLDPLAPGTVDQQLVQWKALDLPEHDAVAEEAATEEVAAEEAAVEEAAIEEPSVEEPIEAAEAEEVE